MFSKRDTTLAIVCNSENTILFDRFDQNHSKDSQSTYRLNDSLYLLETPVYPSYNLTTVGRLLHSNNCKITVRFYFSTNGLVARFN